jgi:GNAT superfamily N-acetyltransferase
MPATMIELRSFEGTAEELHEFVVGAWRKSYGGRMPFPLWSPSYFEWQFGLSDGLPRDHLVAAYDGSRLVGTVLGIPFRFHCRGKEFGGTQGSWLSVDPDYRRQQVGSKLRGEMIQRHRDRQLAGQLGYIFQGSRYSLGNPFWTSKKQHGTGVIRRVGLWLRILDARRAANWTINTLESWAIRLATPLIGKPRRATDGTVRAGRAADLPICLELANELSRQTDWGIVWDEPSLSRHLAGGGVGTFWVVERGGQVAGFCSYHLLPFLGKTEDLVGIMDLVATQRLAKTEAAALVNTCLHALHKSGAMMAVKVRSGDVPWRLMWRCGFIPHSSNTSICFSIADDQPLPERVRRLHVLWR